jgi:hypothetical protein
LVNVVSVCSHVVTASYTVASGQSPAKHAAIASAALSPWSHAPWTYPNASADVASPEK